MGDVVNMAARIMGVAAKQEGGGVCCDQPTREFLLGAHSNLGTFLTLSAERFVSIKGKTHRIGITDLSPRPPTSAGTSLAGRSGGRPGGSGAPPEPEAGLAVEELVGRERELQALSGLAEEFLAGGRESVCCVVEARQGMGKVRTPL